MQELRSTEILDKEIQTDARKKADKLLKKADADCEAILSSVDTDIAKVKAEKQEFYNKKLMAFKNDQNAFMPLEKERFKVGYISETLSKYINDYLTGLSEEYENKLDEITNSINDKNFGIINKVLKMDFKNEGLGLMKIESDIDYLYKFTRVQSEELEATVAIEFIAS